jgi:hypothetical protein
MHCARGINDTAGKSKISIDNKNSLTVLGLYKNSPRNNEVEFALKSKFALK